MIVGIRPPARDGADQARWAVAASPPTISRRGDVAVEMAIILPVLLLFVFGLIDFARLIWTQASLDYAVESAARCAAIDATQCGSAIQVQDYAVSKAFGLDVSPSAFSVAAAPCGKRVSADFSFEFVVPWLATGSLALTAEACYPT
jgi:uncharacterized membrane protein